MCLREARLEPECLVHPVGGGEAHRGHEVAVFVQGQLYAPVTQKLLHVRRVHAPREQERRARVAQVVEPDVRQPRAPKQRLEVLVGDVA